MAAIDSSQRFARFRPVEMPLARFALLVALLALTTAGCSDEEIPMRVVHGSVKAAGKPVDHGIVRFVPIDQTPGPVSSAAIEDGRYRIEARGGVPLGRHRVELRAEMLTGRQVAGGPEGGMIEQTRPAVPPEYGTARSPLVVEVTAEGDGQIDLDLPAADR